MERTLHQAQLMEERSAWSGASILRRTAAELGRNAVFRALAGELIGDEEARSSTDEALLALCPGVRGLVARFYEGRGRQLRELLCPAEVGELDAWLADEIRQWARRWEALDPARSSWWPSTRDALNALRRELGGRALPDAIAALLKSLQRRAARPPGR